MNKQTSHILLGIEYVIGTFGKKMVISYQIKPTLNQMTQKFYPCVFIQNK